MSSSTSGMESMVKFCQERVNNVEKNYGQFCQTLASITRKIAKMRDRGDTLSKQVLDFANGEKISHTTSKNMKEFAHNLAAIQDYREAEVHRLESKVLKPLSEFGPKCKKVKNRIKTEQGAIKKEIKQRANLEKIRDKKPGDAHTISAAETELQKAAADASIGLKGLNKQMLQFEKEKLLGLKQILADFVSIEMVFHAKAIEYYSQCFENLAMVDEDMDLEEFGRKLALSQGSTLDLGGTMGGTLGGTLGATQQTMESTGMTLGSTMGSSSEYTSTGASYTYTYGESTSSSAEKRQSMYADEDDDDDDDDEDDDDEDDEDEENNNAHYSRPIKRS